MLPGVKTTRNGTGVVLYAVIMRAYVFLGLVPRYGQDSHASRRESKRTLPSEGAGSPSDSQSRPSESPQSPAAAIMGALLFASAKRAVSAKVEPKPRRDQVSGAIVHSSASHGD